MILGFFQAQACQFAHGLDNLHLVGACLEQHDVEFGLFFDNGRSGSATASRLAGADIAAADTPNFTSIALTNSLRSITDMLSSAVRNASLSNAILISSSVDGCKV